MAAKSTSSSKSGQKSRSKNPVSDWITGPGSGGDFIPQPTQQPVQQQQQQLPRCYKLFYECFKPNERKEIKADIGDANYDNAILSV